MEPTSIPGFFQTVLESSPIRVAVIDRNGFLVYVNQITAESRTTVQSRTIFDYISKEEGDKVKKIIVEVFETGKTIEYINQGYSPKGKSWYRNIMAPLQLNGKVEHAVITFEIIDDAKEKEEQLENKKAQLSAIINNTNDVILSIDRAFKIIEFNNELAQKVKLGFGLELAAGMSVFDVFFHPDKDKLMSIYQRALKGERIEIMDKFNSSSGRELYYVTNYNPIFTEGEITGISIYSRDITIDKEDEAKLRTALKEKETLLSEIHHRVKNNLAAISSIIQLHALNTDNEEILDLLSSAMNRLKTTALVHEMLYENDSLSFIDFKEYILRLCNHISNTYQENAKQIHIDHHLQTVVLNIKQAIPCGLILNELITNAYKHAFNNRSIGKIKIELNQINEKFILRVSNDGELLSENFDPTNTDSVGMLLIQTLTEQLDAELTVQRLPNTEFKIEFKIETE